MPSRNTDTGFSRTGVFLHWTVAALFLIAYGVIYGKHWFTEEDTAAATTLLQVHQTVGFSILVFVVWRILWRVRYRPPFARQEPKWNRVAASTVHYVLYFFMIAMPISGYLYAKNATLNFGLFTIPQFGDTAAAQWVISNWELTLKEGIRQPMRTFHREIAGELVLWILIVIHASAALYHHYIIRDDVLLRMLPQRFRN